METTNCTPLPARLFVLSATVVILSDVKPWLLAALIAVAGCSDSAPSTGPSPVPSSPITVTATLTDTVTGATIGTSTQTAAALPARLLFAHPGYVTRDTWVHSAQVRTDLIPEAGFDLAFYRQLARNGLESPSNLSTLRILTRAPAIYLQTAGLSAANVAALESAAQAVLPALTGGRFQLTHWETGPEARTPQVGWITVQLVSEPSGPCGRANVGAVAGHIWLNIATPDGQSNGCYRPQWHTFRHELGHALGFWHVDHDAALMKNLRPLAHDGQPSASERHHAAIAYARLPGNEDIDRDPITPASLFAPTIVD